MINMKKSDFVRIQIDLPTEDFVKVYMKKKKEKKTWKQVLLEWAENNEVKS